MCNFVPSALNPSLSSESVSFHHVFLPWILTHLGRYKNIRLQRAYLLLRLKDWVSVSVKSGWSQKLSYRFKQLQNTAFLKNKSVWEAASLGALQSPYSGSYLPLSHLGDLRILDYAVEVGILCRAFKLSFKYRNPYFAATRFFLGCLRLSEDIELGPTYPLNQILVRNTK